ncbi:hypothetical protein F4778DRAFT_786104 [Xylariomycetidae sp. FL2044]|nr:hypothetical protein F4778DRAFT_786104 [Xylariomycetidae sp. FL2044]
MPTDPETALSYAALILADERVEVTPDKLQALLRAAGIEDVEPIWSAIFAKALQGKDVQALVTGAHSAAPGAAGERAQGGGGDKGKGDGEKVGEGDKKGGDGREGGGQRFGLGCGFRVYAL